MQTAIIRNGLFVLEGLEELNVALAAPDPASGEPAGFEASEKSERISSL